MRPRAGWGWRITTPRAGPREWLRAAVPDWRLLRAAALVEIGLFAGLVLGARALAARKMEPDA